MAADWGVPAAAVPFAVLAVALAGALGAALGGRAARLPDRGAARAAGRRPGCCSPAPRCWARPAAVAALAVAYGLYLAVLVVAEARLQERITGRYRATLTSVAGLGIELASLLVFAAWALGGPVAAALLVLAAVPLVASGLRARPGSAVRGGPWPRGGRGDQLAVGSGAAGRSGGGAAAGRGGRWPGRRRR